MSLTSDETSGTSSKETKHEVADSKSATQTKDGVGDDRGGSGVTKEGAGKDDATLNPSSSLVVSPLHPSTTTSGDDDKPVNQGATYFFSLSLYSFPLFMYLSSLI